MSEASKCKNCVWFDKCAQERACDDYEPLMAEDELFEREYKEDLRDRHEYYQELVEEQNS